jgi:hypothetical protein
VGERLCIDRGGFSVGEVEVGGRRRPFSIGLIMCLASSSLWCTSMSK